MKVLATIENVEYTGQFANWDKEENSIKLEHYAGVGEYDNYQFEEFSEVLLVFDGDSMDCDLVEIIPVKGEI